MTSSGVPTALGDSATRVLLAVVDGERTVRGVAARAGLSYGYAWKLLGELRAEGLVGWEDNRQSTIHPLVAEIPPTNVCAMYDGGENGSGPGAALTAPDLANPCTEESTDGT